VNVVREPLYRCAPDCRESFGDLAAKVGAAIGLPPDPEQRDALDAIFAERVPGEPAARHAAIIGSRQNIKTSTLIVASATDLLVLGVPGAVWTAHESKTSTKAFADLLPRLLANEEFAPLVDYRSGRGEEQIWLLDDPAVSLEYRARSGGSGRGFTTSRITLDEALYLRAADMGALLPTMLTRRDAQVRYGSSGGFATSEVLRDLRRRAQDGTDPRLFYVEYGAPKRDCASEDCTHIWGIAEGCALDDRELWWLANCALWSGRIDEENILDLRRSMPWEEFAREVLVWWDDPASAVTVFPSGSWDTLRRDAPSVDPVSFGLDATWDREWFTLAWGVGRYVDIHDHRRGSGWVVDECVRLQAPEKYPRALVCISPKGPAGNLIEPLRKAGVKVKEIPGEHLPKACNDFYDDVIEGRLSHSGHPALDAAVAGACTSGGSSWVWDRKHGAIISPLYAATLARCGAVKPSVGKGRVLVLD
jgi:hypothetical protein